MGHEGTTEIIYSSWRRPWLILGSFLRQFFRSVCRADYDTMRNGFVTVHLAPGSKFNFQKYIKRSLEDDFKVVVGIWFLGHCKPPLGRPPLWELDSDQHFNVGSYENARSTRVQLKKKANGD